MPKDIEVEPYYRKHAKELIDVLHDKDFLNPTLSREGERWLEDYVGFILQSRCQMEAKSAVLTNKLKTGELKT